MSVAVCRGADCTDMRLSCRRYTGCSAEYMLPLKLMMLAGAGVGGMECSGVVNGSRETSLAPSEDSCWS